LPSLHGLEDLIQDAAFGPAHHEGIDRGQGPKYSGRPRHLQPCPATYRIVLRI
jgi:hypothetical protein